MSSSDNPTRPYVFPDPGVTVAHYRLLERLGAGGMGEVHLAQDTKLDRRVALKFLAPALADDADLRARFLREARAAARLDHPNVVTIHEVGEADGRPYIAMQYVEGRSLSELAAAEALPLPRILKVVAGICDGLGRAHAAGITHRDVKPANVIVDAGMRPVLLDFGLARFSGGDKLTKSGSTVGTVAYMSPEQARGGDVDPRSDLFSVGVVLYELLAGRSPFRRDHDAATITAILGEAPEPLARYKAGLPDGLSAVVSKCLAKDPGERYQSAADLAADLRRIERTVAAAAGAAAAKWDAGSAAPADMPSVAVLPFDNMSADAENEYFADGLTEELLNVLAKNPGLKVTGRISSFAFKGKQEDLRSIGQKLGVSTLLEGSVRKAGNRVRITAQLVSAADGFHLWSETYDRVLDDVFAVQDDIAGAVGEALHVKLLGTTKKKDAAKGDADFYALLLRANHAAQQFTKASLEAAVAMYREAIERAPDSARAWAGMARCFVVQAAHGHEDAVKFAVEAKRAAQRAMELDDGLMESHEVLGMVLVAFDFRFREGAAAFRRALECAPMFAAIAPRAGGDPGQRAADHRRGPRRRHRLARRPARGACHPRRADPHAWRRGRAGGDRT